MTGYKQDLTCSIGATQREQKERTEMSESATIDDGGPAFPQKEPLTSDHHGMSLLDYFAGQALAGLVAANEDIANDGAMASPDDVARDAYEYAAEMLAERERINGVQR